VVDDACPFCQLLARGEVVERAEGVAAIADRYPVSPGHTLIVPEAHVPDLFTLPEVIYAALFGLLARVQRRLEGELRPDGFNVGVNVGRAAGQTVAHAHVHLIPRYQGDVADPRGGVRWVVPHRARYWNPND
jgi:diadenosine tetraphosphate (Ap4A) HIT family hydrolase